MADDGKVDLDISSGNKAETENETKTTMATDNSELESQLNRLAPDSIGVEEAASSEHTWKIMVWADPGAGKTHFAYTMPEPVCIIDTEAKADDIAHKFKDKEVRLWQPSDFDEAVEARDQALDVLELYEEEVGEKGTLVVDSMSDMWEWSQYKYIDEWYPNTAPDQVNLDLQDWQKVKDYHNKSFRRYIEECDYNVCWTEIRKDDLGKKLEEGLEETPDKPGGETNNKYKVNSIIRIRNDDNGVPVGDLQKSGLVRWKYLGLTRPTFNKHKEIIESVEEIEADEDRDTVESLKEEVKPQWDVGFTEADLIGGK